MSPNYTELDAIKRLTLRRSCYWKQNTKPDEKGKYGYGHVKIPLTDADILKSINTTTFTIGTATTENGTNLCVAPAIDIDAHDGNDIIPIIKKVNDKSIEMGYSPILEASSGDDINDGCHLIFPCKPTLSINARNALKAILIACGLDVSKYEVFPKQDKVEQDAYGNFVKTIFQYHNRTGKRSTIINPKTVKPFERQDAINYIMTIRDNVFPIFQDTQTPIEPIKEAPNATTEPIKSDLTFDELFRDYPFILKSIKPCIRKAYNDNWKLHGIGDEGHNFRIAIGGNLVFNGCNKELFHEYFKKQSDYSYKQTHNGYRSIVDYLNENKKPMGCKTIKENCSSLLNGMCDTCPNKPKEKKTKESTPKQNNDFDEASEYFYTDMRNSIRLKSKIQGKARYNTSSKRWMVFNGKIWEYDTKGQMLRFAREVVRDLQREALDIENLDQRKNAMGEALCCESLSRLKSMVEMCQSEDGISIDANEFDKNKMILNLQNGTLDLKTGKLLPHNPLDYITKISPISYDPKATCPRFMQFLDEALLFGDEDISMNERISHTKNIIAYLKRYSGYCMTGSTKEEQFLILIGDGGHGKSKYVGAIGYVLGDYYNKIDIATIQESVKAKDGSSPTPDLVKMKGLRFISTSEPEKGLRLNESRIKDFTGRDPITCRDLHASPITYLPEDKLCMYTNYKIIIRGQDKSIWRRVHQIKFDCEPKNIDKDLDLKLQAEGAGILNWMLEGCLEWNNKGLDTPQEIIDNVNEYKDDMDMLSGFFELCCECDKKNRNLKELAKDLFHVYQAWWQVDNTSNAPYFDRQFYHELEYRGYKKSVKPTNSGFLIYGVKLSEEVREAYEKAKNGTGGFNSEGVKEVKQFLVNFVKAPRMEKKPDFSFTSFTPSLKPSPNNDSQKNPIPHKQNPNKIDIKYEIVQEIKDKVQDHYSSLNQISKDGWDWYVEDIMSSHPITKEYAIECMKEARSQLMKV